MESRVRMVNGLGRLPPELIDDVMQRLPLLGAARLALISREWYASWFSRTTLEINREFFQKLSSSRVLDIYGFCNLVPKILGNRIVAQVTKFELYIPPFRPLDSNPTMEVDEWISRLSKRNLLEIRIVSGGCIAFLINQHLFTFLGLEILCLRGMEVVTPHDFAGFENLTILELDTIILTDESFNDLVRNLPKLLDLRIQSCMGLSFDLIVIDLPSLRTFSYDRACGFVDIRNGTNLISLSLGIDCYHLNGHQDCFLSLSKTLQRCPKIEHLSLDGGLCQAVKPNTLSFISGTLKSLSLTSLALLRIAEFEALKVILQQCPNVETLRLSVSASISSFDGRYDPNIRLSNLRWVSVSFSVGIVTPIELKLFQFLLETAPLMENLDILCDDDKHKGLKKIVSSQFICFRKASLRATITFSRPRWLGCCDRHGKIGCIARICSQTRL